MHASTASQLPSPAAGNDVMVNFPGYPARGGSSGRRHETPRSHTLTLDTGPLAAPLPCWGGEECHCPRLHVCVAASAGQPHPGPRPL